MSDNKLDEAIGGLNLVVVAHPDDESLWAGGLICRYSYGRYFTVVCCSTPERDPIRAWKFYAACKRLNAEGWVFPTREPSHLDLSPLSPKLLNSYDCVITHGQHGEYGHPHHKQVHEYLAEHCNVPMVTFGWHSKGLGEHVIELDADEGLAKTEALECYNHQLKYKGRMISKYAALEQRLIELGVPSDIESYDVSI